MINYKISVLKNLHTLFVIAESDGVAYLKHNFNAGRKDSVLKVNLCLQKVSVCNNNFYYMKKIFLSIFIVFVVSVSLVVVAGYAGEKDCFEQPISVSFDQIELGVAFEKLSEMTGVQIIYNEKISQKSVSAVYDNEPLMIVVYRLLRGVNHSLEMDRKSKTLLIKGFGATQYIATDSGGGLPFLAGTGLTYNEMKTLYDEQVKDFEKELTNNSELFEGAGVTVGELEVIYKKQVSEFAQDQDAAIVFPGNDDLSSGELKAIYEKQVSGFDKKREDGLIILPEAGITNGELKVIYEKQVAAFNQKQQKGVEYIEELGMTTGELDRIYNQQVEGFNRILNQ